MKIKDTTIENNQESEIRNYANRMWNSSTRQRAFCCPFCRNKMNPVGGSISAYSNYWMCDLCGYKITEELIPNWKADPELLRKELNTGKSREGINDEQ